MEWVHLKNLIEIITFILSLYKFVNKSILRRDGDPIFFFKLLFQNRSNENNAYIIFYYRYLSRVYQVR